ncbi:Retrovirus-related Pol poly from transposon, partial [Paramuricea clavata]
VLHSDQGANFESTIMHEVCDVMGITKTRTTAYHPQCDGQVERQNRTLQDMLAAFCTKHGNDWDLGLNAVVFAYNTSRQESLQTSPFEIVFGRIPRFRIPTERSQYAIRVHSVA